MKLKSSVMQENLKFLKKSEVSINNFTEDVHELIANKLKNNENSTLWMFNEKDKNKAKVCETQIIFYEINE